MARILIVEDEEDLAGLLTYNLVAAGHTVEAVSHGASALARLKARPPDLLLLDLMLPDISGIEVARIVRADPALRGLRLLMVTAKAEESDRIRGFELGADDYISKPFSVKELLLRVEAVLRRSDKMAAPGASATLALGPICLDPDRHEVTVDRQKVTLTALEFRLLQNFLQRPGRIQTRETLLSDVWGIDAEVTTRTVDTHIKRLREKLGDAGEAIETVRGIGYKMGGT